MKIIIRSDASEVIGVGHLIRCLALADALYSRGSEITFAGNYSEIVKSLILKKRYKVYSLSASGSFFDWEHDSLQMRDILKESVYDSLVVDHYEIDIRWEAFLQPFVTKIMVIDDLANRPHICSILLDQNYHSNAADRYNGLIPINCRTFFGPGYALLRSEFRAARKEMRLRDGKIKRVLVSFGGSDPTKESIKTLEAFKMLNSCHLTADIIAGQANPNNQRIRELCKALPFTNYHEYVNNMAHYINIADLSIGAGGSTTWERIYLGLPSVNIIVAENQRDVTRELDKARVIRSLGWHEQVRAENIARELEFLDRNPQELMEISNNGLTLMADNEECETKVLEALLYGKNYI